MAELENDPTKKLGFSGIRLYGRSQQCQKLKEIFDCVLTNHTMEIAMVMGPSGSGKSAIANWLESYAVKREGFFVRGKFNALGRTEPFHGIVQALAELCHFLIQADNWTDVQTSLRQISEKDISALANFVPQLHDMLQIPTQKEQEEVFGDESCDGTNTIMSADLTSAGTNKKQIGNRMRHAFKLCIRFMCTLEHPVVLFLDDLQWADEASMNWIQTLATDSQMKHLLLIGAYRSNEVDSEHSLYSMLQEIQKQPLARNHTIPLDNLSFNHVNELLSDLLSHNSKETEPLAKVIHQKTMGNAFFTLQFLQMLRDENLLQFSMFTHRWSWNLDDIVSQTGSADNVVQIMAQKIQRLPQPAQTVLKVAACLGSMFHADILLSILASLPRQPSVSSGSFGPGSSFCWKSAPTAITITNSEATHNQEDDGGNDVVAISEFLRLATEEGIIEQTSKAFSSPTASSSSSSSSSSSLSSSYRFVHDRVQQSAYSLIQEESEREWIHFQIGQLLLVTISSTEEDNDEAKETTGRKEDDANDWMTFLAADQFNHAKNHASSSPINEKEKEQRLRVSNLNVKAAELAISYSAFPPAATFLEHGIAFLSQKEGETMVDHDWAWSEHYEFCLKLYLSTAEMHHCTGNFQRCEELIETILDKAQTFIDSTGARLLLVAVRNAQERSQEALDICLDALDQLEEGFVSRRRRLCCFREGVYVEFFKTKFLLRRYTDEDILSLPAMNDKRQRIVIDFLRNVALSAFPSGLIHFGALVILRCVRLSLRHGICEHTPFSFGAYGLLQATVGRQYDVAYRFGTLSLTMAKRYFPSSKEIEALSSVAFYSMIHHWKHPIQESLDPLVHCYKLAMESGDIDCAMFASSGSCELYFASGLPLAPLEQDLRLYCQQMMEHNQIQQRNATLPLWQCVLNLMGQQGSDSNENPLILTGKVMNQDDTPWSFRQKKNIMGEVSILVARLFLSVIFGDSSDATLTLTRSDIVQNAIGMCWSHCFACLIPFYCAILLFEGARRCPGNKQVRVCFLHQANQYKKDLRKLVRAGALNCLHMESLLNAISTSFYCSSGKEQRRKNKKRVKEAFDDAISMCSRHGFQQHHALANELVGLYFHRQIRHGSDDSDNEDSKFWASHYLIRARDVYAEWGAQAKVDQMEAHFDTLFAKPPSSITEYQSPTSSRMMGLRGRSRFTDVTAKLQKRFQFVRGGGPPNA